MWTSSRSFRELINLTPPDPMLINKLVRTWE
jgi:hypothetical protein